MGKGMQIVTGYVTAPSTTFTAWTMASGDSLSVRNCPESAKIHLLNFWGANQTAGYIRIRSALLHDNVIGMTARNVAASPYPLNHMGLGQMLKSQDLLTVEQTGSATGGDIEQGSLLVYYEDLPGAAARLATWQWVMPRIESYMYVTNTLTALSAGGYSGSQVITTTNDQWKANRDYALIGYLTAVLTCSIGWTGPDTSNLRVGGPGQITNKDVTANWFMNLSLSTGLATIPIINAANKAATTIDCATDENGGSPLITSIFALLNGPFQG